ncbi:uncharacterized protein LOC120279120 [Dioscorea cayenensis subsp. rotundata]|uniref:Uncharacterized protein LOC120279120 n=1 Tax=Dioscorea cayennensis subsp. rotundata TaxID=55577 RepID=A0AB40CPR1_DIOCR|nr:uncharacterized protein LOC120279120 [Dioscorea cayenensis subsp. rotundata]
MASNSINICGPLARPARLRRYSPSLMPPFSINVRQYEASKGHSCSSAVMCSTVQESSTVTVPDKKAAEPSPAEATTAQVKPKKPPVKALPEMMAEDVIPSLKAILEAQEDLSQIEITFENNKLEGSFLKNDIPYNFWAFFPNGVLTGPKGFALSSYGSEASTIEPFLIDERRITAGHVVFWVKKRLAAQGILPVWEEMSKS